MLSLLGHVIQICRGQGLKGPSAATLFVSVKMQVPQLRVHSQTWGEDTTSISAQAGHLSWSQLSGLALFPDNLSPRGLIHRQVPLPFAVASLGSCLRTWMEICER